MPGLEQVASPEVGFRQTRQPSVHSVQAASGGLNTLPAGAETGADTGAAFGFAHDDYESGSVAEKVVRSASCPVLTVRGAQPAVEGTREVKGTSELSA